MMQSVCIISIFTLFMCIGLNILRIIIGPSRADRAIAADAIFLNLVSLATVYSIYLQTETYFDLVLVFTLLGFVGTVCFAKFLSRGRIVQ